MQHASILGANTPKVSWSRPQWRWLKAHHLVTSSDLKPLSHPTYLLCEMCVWTRFLLQTVISPLLIYCVFQKATNVAHLSKPHWRARGEHIASQSSSGAGATQTFQWERADLEEKTFGGAINCSHLASIAFSLFSLFIVVPGSLKDTERERRRDRDR